MESTSLNPFTDVKLSPSFNKGHVVSWRLDPFYLINGEEQLELEVSGTPSFSDIRNTIPGSLTAFFITDDVNEKQGHGKDTYYRLKLTIGDTIVYSRTVSFVASRYGRREYVMAREMQRKELLRARKFTGGEVYLVKRRVIAKPVELGYDIDPITMQRLTNQNPTHATEYETGYHAPVKLYASFEDYVTTRDASPGGLGLQARVQQGFRAIGYPAIDTYDLIVDPTNDQRYQVTSQQEYFFPGTDLVVTQLIEAKLLAPTSDLYKIEIPRLS